MQKRKREKKNKKQKKNEKKRESMKRIAVIITKGKNGLEIIIAYIEA